MNKNLRKFMLAGAAMLALGASAQTLESVWSQSTGNLGSVGETRFAAALNGKLIANDKANAKLIYWDAENSGADYGVAVEGVGVGINVDEAGNIIVNKGFPGATSANNWVIIPADGSEQVPLTITTTGTAARVDQIGRVIGNVLSEEGGYMFLPMNSVGIEIIKVVNGAQDSGYSQAAEATGLSINTSTSVQAIPGMTVAAMNDMMDTDGDMTKSFVVRQRGSAAKVFYWGEDVAAGMQTLALKADATEGSTVSPAGAGGEGFEAFALQGQTYYVAPVTPDGVTRSNMFGVFDAEGNMVAHSPADAAKTASQYQTGIALEYVDENSVMIYSFAPGLAMNAYKFSVPAATPADPLYIFGSFNNWDPATSTQMTYANGVYTVEDMILSAGANFAVSSVQTADWTAVNAARYGFEVNDSFAKIGANTIVKGEGAMKVALDGIYDITVDLNAMTITLAGEISYPEHVYAIGNLAESSWDTTKSIELATVEDGVYEGQVTLVDSGDGSSYFSIVTALGTTSDDWTTVNASARFGAAENNAAIALDEAKAIGSTGSGAYSWMTTPDTYYINVNLNTLEVKLSKNSTGVEGIAVEANDVPAVYYNLQGVEVANPENGLYIVKRGNKVSKELIRR